MVVFTLGVNAAFHDSSACLVEDGKVVAAAEEERFTGIKHAKRPVPFSAYELPFNAIDYCLSEPGIRLGDVGHVAYSFNPHLLREGLSGSESITLPLEPSRSPVVEAAWEQLLVAHIINAPRHLQGGVPHHLRARLACPEEGPSYSWHFVDHHLSHAASAWLPSPFGDAAVLTVDGRGERVTTSYWLAEDARIELLSQVEMPHSLGLLYERVTDHLGFLHSSDEYKVMALASLGRPVFLGVFRNAIHVGLDGDYTIDGIDFEGAFGRKRLPGEQLEQRHYDLACSAQTVLEETVETIVRWLRQTTGCRNLCLAGGVALNCVLNSRLRDARIFDDIWVQPAAGDAGTALGSALWIDFQHHGRTRQQPMDDAYLGPGYSDAEIEELLKASKLDHRRAESLPDEIADHLMDNRIVGWFQGRMEFGPRALGARSILASPCPESMQERLNQLKDREDFRPVAPVILEDRLADWFSPPSKSPFMLFVHEVRPEKRGLIPAIQHVDGTARIQTINRRQNAVYYDVIESFERRTGVPILVNTSLNVRGKPIVCTPRQAIECFMTSSLDVLALGSFILEKGRGENR